MIKFKYRRRPRASIDRLACYSIGTWSPLLGSYAIEQEAESEEWSDLTSAFFPGPGVRRSSGETEPVLRPESFHQLQEACSYRKSP